MEVQRAELRAAFDLAVRALLVQERDDVEIPRSVLCPLLDYVGIREFTPAAQEKAR